MTLSRLIILATASALSLAACSRDEEAPVANDAALNEAELAGAPAADGESAGQSFNLAGGDGKPLGTVSLNPGANGVSVTINASGMPAGTHGLHLHEKGQCDGPTFQSAGAHWNPAAKKHGRDNPQGAHLGDLPNLEVSADGSATTSFDVAGAMMASGSTMLADADGTSLVVHAKADDYKTDPSGDSGDRIACTVLAPPK